MRFVRSTLRRYTTIERKLQRLGLNIGTRHITRLCTYGLERYAHLDQFSKRRIFRAALHSILVPYLETSVFFARTESLPFHNNSVEPCTYTSPYFLERIASNSRFPLHAPHNLWRKRWRRATNLLLWERSLEMTWKRFKTPFTILRMPTCPRVFPKSQSRIAAPA